LQGEQTNYQQLRQQAEQAGERVRQLREDVAARQRGVFLVAKQADDGRGEIARHLEKLTSWKKP